MSRSKGRYDRSLARSAWTVHPRKGRPVGYVMRVPRGFQETSIATRNTLGSAAPDHTVPYWPVLSRGGFPSTSCQATIVPSRDISKNWQRADQARRTAATLPRKCSIAAAPSRTEISVRYTRRSPGFSTISSPAVFTASRPKPLVQGSMPTAY